MKKLSMDELQRSSIEEYKNYKKFPLVVVLDSIRSMSNVGSIFRTCDGFAVEKLILCGITAQPPHKEISKTALGATESVEWEYCQDVVEIVQRLKLDNYKVFLIEQTDHSIMLDNFNFKFNDKIAIIF